jgi:hypothetical protein
MNSAACRHRHRGAAGFADQRAAAEIDHGAKAPCGVDRGIDVEFLGLPTSNVTRMDAHGTRGWIEGEINR